ncbi:hypothetical protein EK21DRAFT_105858 [Setomelanomma holmii]|uniref:Uncharacterized protein n=1 Tax=Setomelanomma holmii TaxID=210430 RepID=A0A9P4LTC6_9PLEO|nr:hypothetical protein EK21DRAFT_105858 [Setomelanomma holmii]
MHACESFPDGIHPKAVNASVGGYPPVKSFVPGQALERYGNIASHRLPALAGIAEAVSTMLNTDYIAGMWGNEFPHTLLWKAFRTDKSVQPPEYVALTWSWASMWAPIYYPPNVTGVNRYLLKPCVDILEINITPAVPGNPFGQILDGFILVQGRLGIIDWDAEEPATPPRLVKSKLLGAYVSPQASVIDLSDQASVMERSLNSWNLDRPDQPREGPTYLLPVVLTTAVSPLDGNIHRLLLSRSACGRFRRIGTAELKDDNAAKTVTSLPSCEITII